MKKILLIFLLAVTLLFGMSGCSAQTNNESLNRVDLLNMFEENGYKLTSEEGVESHKFLILDKPEDKITLAYFSEGTGEAATEEILYKNFNINDSQVNILLDESKLSETEKNQLADFQKWLKIYGVTKEQVISIFKEASK